MRLAALTISREAEMILQSAEIEIPEGFWRVSQNGGAPQKSIVLDKRPHQKRWL